MKKYLWLIIVLVALKTFVLHATTRQEDSITRKGTTIDILTYENSYKLEVASSPREEYLAGPSITIVQTISMVAVEMVCRCA